MPKIRHVAEAAAHSALADLLRGGDSFDADTATVALAGERWTVVVSVVPSKIQLDEIERDLLLIVAHSPHPLSTSAILVELTRRGLDYSESTVKRRLARLVRLKVIQSRSVVPRGYCLPDAH